jgi:hypothetical protein
MHVADRAVRGVVSALLFLLHSSPATAHAPLNSTAPPPLATASRVADLLQSFGVNTFSKLNNHGYNWSWGGSQGDYDANTTSNALNFITADSGLTLSVREYHHNGENNSITPLQLEWIRHVHAATNAPFSLAIGAMGGADDISGIVALVQDSVASGLHYVRCVVRVCVMRVCVVRVCVMRVCVVRVCVMRARVGAVDPGWFGRVVLPNTSPSSSFSSLSTHCFELQVGRGDQ